MNDRQISGNRLIPLNGGYVGDSDGSEELIAADFPSAAVAYGCGDELMEGRQWPEKLYRFQILLRSSNGEKPSIPQGIRLRPPPLAAMA